MTVQKATKLKGLSASASPEPDVLAQEIAGEVQTRLEQFSASAGKPKG
jgi:hypothetical protein